MPTESHKMKCGGLLQPALGMSLLICKQAMCSPLTPISRSPGFGGAWPRKELTCSFPGCPWVKPQLCVMSTENEILRNQPRDNQASIWVRALRSASCSAHYLHLILQQAWSSAGVSSPAVQIEQHAARFSWDRKRDEQMPEGGQGTSLVSPYLWELVGLGFLFYCGTVETNRSQEKTLEF